MQVGQVQAQADAATEPPDEPRVPLLAVLTTLLAGVALVLALTVHGEAARLHILSAFLLVLAVAEGFYGIQHLVRPQQFATGPPNIYARQHFGLYNLFAALLYVIAAIDPVKYNHVWEICGLLDDRPGTKVLHDLRATAASFMVDAGASTETLRGACHDCDELVEDLLFSRAQSLEQTGLCRWDSAPQPASAVLELKPEPVVGGLELNAAEVLGDLASQVG